jgi:class 3 adenylate cyclase
VSDPRVGSDDDIKALVDHVLSLGATQEDIERAARVAGLGPLALDLTMRPEGPAVPFEAFLEATSMDPGQVRRLWSALGLPESPPMPFPVTSDVQRALEALSFLSLHLGEEAVLGLARVIGSSVARIADALSSATRVGVEMPQIDTGMPYSEVARNYTTVARELLPILWDAIGAIFRRHLVLVSYQRWSTDEERVAVTVERAVGFVDLVGSTDVLRTLSVSETAALVNRFEQMVWDSVTSAGGRVVKLIGDEAMFVADEPVAACRLASAMVERSADPVRVGLAVGPAVAMHGDYYGPTVNLAARLVAVAPPSSVIVSDAVKDVVGGVVGDVFAFEPFPTGPLRGFPDVSTAFRLTASSSLPSSR